MAVNQGKSVFRLVGSIFTGVGLILLAVGVWAGERQYTIMKSWPTVEATVAKSRMTHYLDRHGSSIMYQVEIDFRYTLDGKPFDTPSTPGYSTSNYTAMKRIADAYAPGTRHIIRYNPAEPNDIRMNAGYNFGFFLLPTILGGMAVLFTGLGIALLVASRSMQLRLCPACGQMVEPGQRFCPNCAAPLQSRPLAA
jgi:hypothetical protein